MQFSKPLAAAAVAAGLALGTIAVVPAAAQQMDMEPAPTPDFPDEILLAFAEVAIEVSGIHEQYSMQIETADSDAEREQLIEEGNAAMLTAVEDAPQITVEEYLQVGEAAATDPELGQRINALIQELAEG
jgi:hypothetical protein